ncbi:MAG: HisA/HisF-related TIM barrel protein, partial [Methylocystis sp.]
MQIVPVIDIRNGAVVRARAGARDAYRPMSSPLAATSAPPDIVAGFLTLHPFKKIYVADLDAIQETGDNQRQIAALIDSFPALCFMIDAGGTSLRWRGAARTECVIGSESLRDSESLRALKDAPNTLLSLDFRDEA